MKVNKSMNTDTINMINLINFQLFVVFPILWNEQKSITLMSSVLQAGLTTPIIRKFHFFGIHTW